MPAVEVRETPEAQRQEVRRPHKLEKWQAVAWMTSGLVLALSIVGLFALVGYTLWQTLAWLQRNLSSTEQFILTSIALTTAGMLRYLAMLTGIALAAGGLLVSFLTINQAIGLSARSEGADQALVGSLRTNSPGVMAIVVGSLIVICALFASTSFNTTTSSPGRQGTPAGSAESLVGPMPSVQQLLQSQEAASAPRR
jgi:hypothetical protein